MKRAVTKIGGADGPTAIFLCGKEQSFFERLKSRLRWWKHERQRRMVARLLAETPLIPHTIAETLSYIKERYPIEEQNADCCQMYEERRNNLRFSLIQKRQPDLLGEIIPVRPPKDLSDEQEVLRWQQEVRQQSEEMERRAAAVPKEDFPMDYHFYVIDQGENGQLEIEADFIHQELCCSYGGNKEKLWPILKDIYLYYGISREDTKQKTERYRMLESILVA